MKGTCRLTKKESVLCNSHIYPKFVVDWTKETGSKYLRGYLTPNKREQDGLKKYLLSQEAEQLFSIREKWFSEKVFYPYLKDWEYEIIYDENLFYFAVSFLWRILILELEQPNIADFAFFKVMKDAEKEWRDFLLKGIYPQNFDRFHLILTMEIKDHTLPSDNVDFFMTRMMDGTTVFNVDNNNCSIYGKFSRFIFWSFLTKTDEHGMIKTKINPIGGTMKADQRFDNNEILSFIPHRIKLLDERMLPTEKQQEKIAKDLIENTNSDLLRSMEFDFKMKKKNRNNGW